MTGGKLGSTSKPAREWLTRQLDCELAEVMRRADEIKVEPFRASADG